jgi:GNAT superfamily N-acetyltransferase
MSQGVTVRQAKPGERAAVLSVLDAADLQTDADRVGAAIASGDVLVATADPAVQEDDGEATTFSGALVLDGREIVNVAVRRRRRNRGIGRALVEAAAKRRTTLVATFDEGVRPFYEALGFALESGDGDRWEGRLDRGGP